MSRPPIAFVGLLLALLVLVFGNAATGKETSQTATTEVPGEGASAPDRPSATPSPEGPAAAASRKSDPDPGRKLKPQPKQRSQFRPSEKTASNRSQKSKSRPSAKRPKATHGGVVYLTFDDGPSAYTPAILQILRASHSTATFFELGFRQAQYPGAAAQVRAEGSSIGNHTYNHPDLTVLTSGQVRWQVTHGPRGRCLRPPYGATDPRVRRIVAQQGLREVLWTIDTNDWSRPGTAQIVKAATGPRVRSGSTVLLHDGGGDRSQTVAALPMIIRTLQQRGYAIRRIPGC
jgi:peptidoglycan-N-acetylglucosamine deacetylase